jgi:hypothetical protein
MNTHEDREAPRPKRKYVRKNRPERGKDTDRRCAIKRSAMQDPDAPAKGEDKTRRIDLGLALLHRRAIPGVSYGPDEIAWWCGCTDQAIRNIEQRALKKIRNFLQFQRPEIRAGLATHFFDHRTPAHSSNSSKKNTEV